MSLMGSRKEKFVWSKSRGSKERVTRDEPGWHHVGTGVQELVKFFCRKARQ